MILKIWVWWRGEEVIVRPHISKELRERRRVIWSIPLTTDSGLRN